MIKLVCFRSVTHELTVNSHICPKRHGTICLHRVELSQSTKKTSRLSYALEASNSSISPLFLCRSWQFDIETPILIVAHYGQPVEPMLYLNQPFKHNAINANLPSAAFAQRLKMRGVQTNLLRQIGKEVSINDLSFISVCPLNCNKLGRLQSVH